MGHKLVFKYFVYTDGRCDWTVILFFLVPPFLRTGVHAPLFPAKDRWLSLMLLL